MSRMPFRPSGTTIPIELLSRIIKYFDPQDDGPILARLSRCSRASHDLAIRVLYSHIHLRSDQQMIRLLQGLSLERGDDGEALPCATLTDVPVCSWRRRSDVINIGQGTRKLSHFMYARYVTLHFVPSEAAFPARNDPYLEPIALVQVQTGLTKVVNEFIFPRVQGLILGNGFISDLLAILTRDHPTPCRDPDHTVDDEWWTDRNTFWRAMTPELMDLRFLNCLFGVHPICWNLDQLPSAGLCGELQELVVSALVSDRMWGRYMYRLNTHSTFPRTSLAPWTRSYCHWRHFIHVDDRRSSPVTQEHSPSIPLTRTNADPEQAPQDEDEKNEQQTASTASEGSDLLTTLAKDVYGIASDTLEKVAYGEKARRRDIVLSGLSIEQIRELEQRFVDIIEDDFENPQDVIVDPSLSRRNIQQSDAEADAGEEDDSDYDSNDNRAGDGDSDPEDDDAVRDHQKRVLMFDFFHSSECSTCEACGLGGGRQGGLQHRIRDGFLVD